MSQESHYDVKVKVRNRFVPAPNSDLLAEVATTVSMGIVCICLCYSYFRIARVLRRRLDAVKNTVPKAFNDKSVSYDFDHATDSDSSIDAEWEFFYDADDFNPFAHKITREVHYYRKRRVRLNDLRACGLLPPRPDPYFCDDDIDLSVYDDIDVTNVPADFDRQEAMERAFQNVPNRVMYKLLQPGEANPLTREEGETVELPKIKKDSKGDASKKKK